MNFFDRFNPSNKEDIKKPIENTQMFSMESMNENEQTNKDVNKTNINLKNILSLFKSTESIYNIRLITNPMNIKRHYSTEADEDPFGDIGEDLDETGDGVFDDGGFDDSSFEDASGGDDMFSDDSWGDDSEGEENKKKALEVSRSELLEESHNLGAFIRRNIPKKFLELIEIIESNIEVLNKYIYDGKNEEDISFIKDSYQDLKEDIVKYKMIIDSKTFDEMYADYVSYLFLMDKLNDMFYKIVKSEVKNNK